MIEIAIQIDYAKLWAEQIKNFVRETGVTEYWDRRRPTFDSIWRTSTYAEEFISRLNVRPEFSVLDVACGTGAISIPLAGKVRRVTALDISSDALQKLRGNLVRYGLSNITFVNKDWNDIAPDQEIEKHDVVLLSRAVMINPCLVQTLYNLDRFALTACYVTWRTDRDLDEYDAPVAAALHKRYSQYPDYLTIYGMLCQMGFSPEIKIMEAIEQENYPNLETAIRFMARGATIDDRQHEDLLAIAREKLRPVNGFYALTRKIKWAVIYWRK